MGITEQQARLQLAAGQRAFRRQLAAQERDTANRLADAYAGVLERLGANLAAVVEEAEASSSRVHASRVLRESKSVQALQEQMRFALDDYLTIVIREARKMEESGRRGARPTAEANFETAGLYGRFNMPSVDAMRELVNLVDSPAMQARLAGWAGGHVDAVSDLIIADGSLGKSPIATARHIVRYVENTPWVDAQRLARTVQIYAMRQGTAAIYQQNADVVLGWWWGSSLDGRTCMSCLAQHGRKFPNSEVLRDHYNGRCSPIPITAATSDEEIPTGEEWFRKQPEDKQSQQMGKGRWQAWKDGEFGFDALTGAYKDDVFGTMYYSPSLKQIRKTSFDRAAAPGAFAPQTIDIQRQQMTPYEQIRRLGINAKLLDEEPPESDVVSVFYNMFAYDDQGNPQFKRELIDQEYAGLLYDIWRIGRDTPKPADIDAARLRAGAVLHAYESEQMKITLKERRQLQRMAYGDVAGAIEEIKDNRMRGRGGGGTRSTRNTFRTASEIEGAQRLREASMAWWAQQDVRGAGNIDFDF